MDYASVPSHAYTSPSSRAEHENILPDNKPAIPFATGVFLISSSVETELDEPLKQNVINKVLCASEVISLLNSSDDDEVDEQFCRASFARQFNTSADVHCENIQPEIKPNVFVNSYTRKNVPSVDTAISLLTSSESELDEQYCSNKYMRQSSIVCSQQL